MLAYVVRKTLSSILVLFLASIVLFVLTNLSGDPLLQLRQNPQVSGEDIQRISERYGLDQPIYVQYGIWFKDAIQGDFGTSFKQNTDVNSIIARRIWPTALLMGSSLLLAVAIAVPFGVYSAIKQYSLVDKVGTFASFLGYSMPIFWLALILQLVFAVYLTNWLGMRIFYVSGYSMNSLWDLLQRLTLPALSLAIIQIAEFSRFQRGAMLDVLSSDYLRTARAKGLSRRKVYLKHGLRNALIPTVTIVALSIGTVFGGAVVTETVFSWPGLGFLLIDSLYKGDYNVTRALLVIGAALIIVFNLVADIVYSFVDPRVRYD
ncbi:MAG: ABC transporter permease [Rubrobacteraceae bacterium]